MTTCPLHGLRLSLGSLDRLAETLRGRSTERLLDEVAVLRRGVQRFRVAFAVTVIEMELCRRTEEGR